MMDYAGRVEEADTYPKLLRLNAKEHGADIALREKDLGLWRLFTWNDYQTRVRDFALGMLSSEQASSSSTEHPRSAASRAAVTPANPPPTTITSCIGILVSSNRSDWYNCTVQMNQRERGCRP